jgi:hypothetical protein
MYSSQGIETPQLAAKASIWMVPLPALVTITAVDLALRGRSGVSGLFAVVPALAIFQGVDRRRFHLIGGATFLTCVMLAVIQWRGDALASAGGVVTVMVVCGAGCLDHQRRLADTQAVAEVVQRALLRPLPSRLGPLQLETRYLASAPQALIGGDMYDAAWTPYGIRLIAEWRRSRSVRRCRRSGCSSSARSTPGPRSASGRAMVCCFTPTDSARPATRAESSSRWPSVPHVPSRRI